MQLSLFFVSADVLQSLNSVTCWGLSLPISKMGISKNNEGQSVAKADVIMALTILRSC